MHVHIVEPRADGHRMQYVRRLIEHAPPDWPLTLSTFASAMDHPGTAAARQAGGQRLRVLPISGEDEFEARVRGADGFKLQPAYWQLLRRHWASLSQEQRGERVLVPYLDYISYAIGTVGSPFGPTPFAGVVMRPDFHWQAQGVVAPASRHGLLKRWLFLRLLRHPQLRSLVTIDPSLRDWVRQRAPAGAGRLHYADDPADLQGQGDRHAARQQLGLHAQGTVILMFGSIDLRKGVAAALDLVARPEFPADGQLLLVGRQSEEVRRLVASHPGATHPGRVVSLDRYVDRQDEWLAFAAADFGWLAYEGFFGPSGVLAQCRQAGLPMIHRAEGLIGYQLRKARQLHLAWLSAVGLRASQLSSDPASSGGLEQVYQS